MPVFQGWFMKHESPFKAYCKLCTKTIDMSNMGKWVLTSHAKSKSYTKAARVKQGTAKIEQFVKLELIRKVMMIKEDENKVLALKH